MRPGNERVASARMLVVVPFEIPGPKAGRFRLTPAMQAGLNERLWKIEDLYDAVMAA